MNPRVSGPKRIPKKKRTAAELQAIKTKAKQKRAETRYRSSVKEIFAGAGFAYIKTEGHDFEFKVGDSCRKTEFDGLFVYENIIVILEDTCMASPDEHLAKKLIAFELILTNTSLFIDCLKAEFSQFSDYFEANHYEPRHYVVRIVYFSMHSIGSEHVQNAQRKDVHVVSRPIANYFIALVRCVSKSARYELLKFLKVAYLDVGELRMSGGATRSSITYPGILLPEENSSYPPGYKLVSFYADPASLLKKAYVLRKNSWEAPNLSYQRVLDFKKIKSMRKYLTEQERVYLGNIVATLPPGTKIEEVKNSNQMPLEQQITIKAVGVSLPEEYNVIGVVDGQHRVYSYHEGNDSYEKRIARIRGKQNLLVTGIIFPETATDEDRIRFEARLFLEINSEQTKVKSVLTQEIQLLVSPFSATAIARSVLEGLSQSGALRDKLEEHIFDNIAKLKVSSIVSFGLRPLTKKDGDDSLFKAWSIESGRDVTNKDLNDHSRKEYVEFCVYEINLLLNAVKINSHGGWEVGHGSKLMTPTSVNGFLKCLRIILEKGNPRNLDDYVRRLKEISSFNFEDYKSSQWNSLGKALYEKYFA